MRTWTRPDSHYQAAQALGRWVDAALAVIRAVALWRNLYRSGAVRRRRGRAIGGFYSISRDGVGRSYLAVDGSRRCASSYAAQWDRSGTTAKGTRVQRG